MHWHWMCAHIVLHVNIQLNQLGRKERGLKELQSKLALLVKSLPKLPGVYQMLDELGQLLYVGKAKSLQARVSSYFNQRDHSVKTRHLVGRICDIQTTVTSSETEALLLEQTLIKRHSPPYNILMRDDKSYPYIYISQHDYPRIGSVRGRRRQSGQCFGPFPSGSAVRFSLGVLQKAFQVRQCQDSYFRNRTRPCLEYQIQRCSGPCVGLISKNEYQQSVDDTARFLRGESTALMADLTKRMETASTSQLYESAAKIRDQIATLRQIQEVQHMDTADGNVDVFAVSQDDSFICVQTLVVRNGQLIGGKSHFQKTQLEISNSEVLEGFIAQYYLNQDGGGRLPDFILASHPLPNTAALEQFLVQSTEYKLRILKRVQGHKQAWLNMAVQNAQQGLNTRRVTHSRRHETYAAMRDWLNCVDLPELCVNRFECFDISHTQGEATKASCVVFDPDGPRNDLYRRYNIRTTDTGDDYQAMAEVLQRRYSKVEHDWPWLVVIDGGPGQLMQAARVLKSLSTGKKLPELCLISLAKGVTRKAGFERLYQISSLAGFCTAAPEDEFDLLVNLPKPEDESVLRLLQEIRDESHRFAIVGHRKARDKARRQSTLESIAGVGPKRRSALLKYFGGLQGVKRASIEELSKVTGINNALAELIYKNLKGEG